MPGDPVISLLGRYKIILMKEETLDELRAYYGLGNARHGNSDQPKIR